MYVCKFTDNPGTYVCKEFLIKNLEEVHPSEQENAKKRNVLITNHYEREVNILKQLKHPNVVRLVYNYSSPNKDKLYLFVEWFDSSLDKFLKNKRKAISQCLDNSNTNDEVEIEKLYLNKWWQNDELKFILSQILEGIAYLHSIKIAHLDLKVIHILSCFFLKLFIQNLACKYSHFL